MKPVPNRLKAQATSARYQRSARPRPVSVAPPPAAPPEIHPVAPYGSRQRIDAYLSRYLSEHSRSEWQRLIESGVVTLNGARARSSTRLAIGDRLEIRPVPAFA